MKASWLNWLFFIFIFLSIYGGAHVLMFFKLRVAWGLQVRGSWWLGFFLLLMVFSPMGERFLERAGAEVAARSVAYFGYVWMGIIFVMLMTYAALSVYRGLAFLARKIIPALPALFSLPDSAAVLTALGLAVVVTLYGWTEAHFLHTRHVRLTSAKISRALGSLKIAQISDVHLGLIHREGMLRRITAILQKEQPDLLVSTGDLVDGELNNLACVGQCLEAVHPRFGKYAVTGNHEFYAGVDQALKYTRAAGFKVLRQEAVSPEGLFNLAGVDDPAMRMTTGQPLPPERELLEPLPRNLFTILLKHQPRVGETSRGLFDLQLSGHTHSGQIFPFGFFVYLAYHIPGGLTALGENAWLYVSPGTGTWGPPIRFLAPPEVTIFDISALPEKP